MKLLVLLARKRKTSLLSKRADMADLMDIVEPVKGDLLDLLMTVLVVRLRHANTTEKDLAVPSRTASTAVQSIVICLPRHHHHLMDLLVTTIPGVIITVGGLKMLYLLKITRVELLPIKSNR